MDITAPVPNTKLSKIYVTMILLILLVIFEPAICQQKPLDAKRSTESDIFDQLQYNVWYLPTADSQSRLYVTELGKKGPQVVVLHGGPGNNFNYLVKPLSHNLDKYKFILFDQRGSLLSPVPDSMVSKLSMDVLVSDLETLRRSLGEEKLILFGHSFGTFLAMAYYIKYPQHVKGIILTASLPPYTTASYTLTDFSKEMSRLQNELRSRPEVRQIMAEQGVLDTGKVLTDRKKSIRAKIDGRASFNIYQIEKWNEFQGGGIYYNAKVSQTIGNTMSDIYDIRPSLEEFPISIYVIQGDHDFVDPAGYRWAEVVKQYPRVRLSVIRNAAHYSWIDDPNMFQKCFAAGLEYILLPIK